MPGVIRAEGGLMDGFAFAPQVAAVIGASAGALLLAPFGRVFRRQPKPVPVPEAPSLCVVPFATFMAKLVGDIRDDPDIYDQQQGFYLSHQIDSMAVELAKSLKAEPHNPVAVREAMLALPGAAILEKQRLLGDPRFAGALKAWEARHKLRISEAATIPDEARKAKEIAKLRRAEARATLYFVPPAETEVCGVKQTRAERVPRSPANDAAGVAPPERRDGSAAAPVEAQVAARAPGGNGPGAAKSKRKTRTIADVRDQSIPVRRAA